MKFVITLVLCLATFGCASMSSRQETQLRTWESEGISLEEKSPTTGALLGLLPGIGSFYTGQIGLGVVDLLLWPYSVLWDPVAGYQGSKLRNWEATAAHVEDLEKVKKVALNKLEDMRDNKEVDDLQYRKAKRDIDALTLRAFEDPKFDVRTHIQDRKAASVK
jgi:hypothetical protein